MRACACSSCCGHRARCADRAAWRPNTSSTRPSRTFRASTLIRTLSSRTASAYTPLTSEFSSCVGDFVLGEERRGERRHIERRQIFGSLAEADVADRQTELAADGQGDPALRGAVELRQGDGGHPQRLLEYAR